MGTIADQLNTAMRDFQRYSGDGLPGEPVGRPLPVGDPASGQHNPPKKQVREAFLAIAETADDLTEAAAGAAADRLQTGIDRAATEADAAAALTAKNQAQVAAIAAGAPIVTVLTDPAPSNDVVEILQTDAGAQVWQVSGGAWGLVGWLSAPEFSTKDAMTEALGFFIGQTATVINGFNGDREGFTYDPDSALPTSAFVVSSDAGGQWVSNRKIYTDFAELDADPRAHEVGTYVQILGETGFFVVASDEDFETSGGNKLQADRVLVKAFGAKGNGVVDDTAALRRAAATGKTVIVTTGIYLISGTITFPGDMRMKFEDGAYIFAGPGTYPSGNAIEARGSVTQISDLGTNAIRGGITLEFATAPDLAFDDTVMIFNPTNKSWSPWRDGYKAGEFCHIDALSGTTATIQGALYDSYATGDVDVYKVNPIVVDLDNPRVESDGSASCLIYAEYSKGPSITNPQLKNRNNFCLFLARCIDGDIFGGRMVNEGDGGDDYANFIGNSQNVTVHGGSFHARRHAVASGGDIEVGCVPCRGIKYIGSRITNDRNSGTHAADMHGNADHCGFYNCHIMGGVSPQGSNVTIDNCDIYGGISGGVVVYAAEVLGGTFTITNNRFHSFTDPTATARGLIDFSNVSPFTVEDLTVLVRGNTFTSSVMGSNLTIVLIRNFGCIKKINADVSGNDFNLNDFARVLWVRYASGTADSDFLIADNNKAKVRGKYSIWPDAAYTVLPVLRCQKTVWTDTVTTSTSSNLATGATKTFNWAFPRLPSVTTGKSDGLYAGNRVGVVAGDVLTATTARLTLATDDATDFASAASCRINGTAEICEV